MPAKLQAPIYQLRKTCRVCASKNLSTAFPMVQLPVGDNYLTHEQRHEVQETLPSDIIICSDCGNVQTAIDVNPDVVYRHYIWTTSSSPGLVKSYQDYVDDLAKRFPNITSGLAVEIGSNDGIFCKLLKEKGFKVLGIEPAENLAQVSNESGIETIADFFGPKLAGEIKSKYGAADLIVANHVFPNANDVKDIADSVEQLLSPGGVFVVQVFYLYDVVKDNLLENFEHEHVTYFYVRTLKHLLAQCELELFDITHVGTKGGSIRCFVQHKGGPHAVSPNIASYVQQEESFGLHKPETYKIVTRHIEDMRSKFKAFLDSCKAEGKKVAAYGTSVGATVFTYQYELGDDIGFFVDDNERRHGLYTPGFRIPVKSPEAIYEERPDFVIVMAPLYADLIIGKHQKYLEQGGHFVKFRPEFEIV